jgi:hypothetical protein
MPMADPGWPWAGGAETPPPANLEQACARLFASPDGQLLLAHLRRQTQAVALGPEASEARLRHLEGQRAMVLSLEALARRGARNPLSP